MAYNFIVYCMHFHPAKLSLPLTEQVNQQFSQLKQTDVTTVCVRFCKRKKSSTRHLVMGHSGRRTMKRGKSLAARVSTQVFKGFLELNVAPLPGWVAALVLACLDHCSRVDTFPVCSYSQAGCPLPLLADVFDRVIQQSSKMHAASSELHSKFVSLRSSPAL